MRDDELETLLGDADGERPLPPGLEAQLLSDILDTASRTDVPVPARTERSDGSVVDLVPADKAIFPPRRVRWVAVAAAIAALFVVGALVRAGDDDAGIAADGPSRTTAPAPPALTSLTDEALCTTLSEAARVAMLDRTGTDSRLVDADAIEGVAEVLAELHRRTQDPIISRAATLVLNAAVEQRLGSVDSAQTAHTTASVAVESVLDTAC